MSDTAVPETLSLLRTKYLAAELNVTPPRSGKAGNVGIEGLVPIERLKLTMTEVADELLLEEDVVFVIE